MKFFRFLSFKKGTSSFASFLSRKEGQYANLMVYWYNISEGGEMSVDVKSVRRLPAGASAASAKTDDEGFMIRKRYKVVRVLWVQRDYALVEAVDIAERETPERLINLFEGGLLHRYGRIFSELKKEECPSFREVFMEGDTLAAVFDNCQGEMIDFVFHKEARWKWEDRLEFAELILHQGLLLFNVPPEISCAAMLSENVFFDLEKRWVRLRYMLLPMENLQPRELTLLVGDHVKKILPRNIFSTDAERDFLNSLDAGGYLSMTLLYSAWRDASRKIREQREEFRKAGLFRKGWILLKHLIRNAKERQGGQGV